MMMGMMMDEAIEGIVVERESVLMPYLAKPCGTAERCCFKM